MTTSTRKQDIRLIVCDIEGCLSPGKGSTLDLAALAEIQIHNRNAWKGRGTPITLCTGRSQPFVEAFCQILSVHLPCVCENGAYLYDFKKDWLMIHPDITGQHLSALQELGQYLDAEVQQKHPHRRESGKDICISLNPDAPPENYADEIQSLYEHIKPYVNPELFSMTHSASAVDITPRGIDKAAGVRFLSGVMNLSVGNMLGIGDTAGDLPFLRITGLAATPANGAEAVKSLSHYASLKPDARGVLDIIQWIS